MAAHSITNTCATEVNPSAEVSRCQKLRWVWMDMSIAAWPRRHTGTTTTPSRTRWKRRWRGADLMRSVPPSKPSLWLMPQGR